MAVANDPNQSATRARTARTRSSMRARRSRVSSSSFMRGKIGRGRRSGGYHTSSRRSVARRLTFAGASTTFVEHFGAVAKLVRQRTANPSFPGSNPGGTSKQHQGAGDRAFFHFGPTTRGARHATRARAAPSETFFSSTAFGRAQEG